MRLHRFLFILSVLLIAHLANESHAAEVIPPSPTPHYIVDAAHVLSPGTVSSIDAQLQQVERDTSNQIVVALYPKMQSNDDIAAYAVRVFQAWHIGQKSKNNGILLLVFTDDRKMNITTGYGLEGSLPDATAKQIIDNEIKPHFQSSDYDGGIRAGVNAILAATRGEYKGTGVTNLDNRSSNIPLGAILIFTVFALIFFSSVLSGIYGTTYAGNGRVPSWVVPFILLSNMLSSRRGYTSGGGGGGWSGGRGGWSGGGGGGFSGGGGSTGGGGASGSW